MSGDPIPSVDGIEPFGLPVSGLLSMSCTHSDVIPSLTEYSYQIRKRLGMAGRGSGRRIERLKDEVVELANRPYKHNKSAESQCFKNDYTRLKSKIDDLLKEGVGSRFSCFPPSKKTALDLIQKKWNVDFMDVKLKAIESRMRSTGTELQPGIQSSQGEVEEQSLEELGEGLKAIESLPDFNVDDKPQCHSEVGGLSQAEDRESCTKTGDCAPHPAVGDEDVFHDAVTSPSCGDSEDEGGRTPALSPGAVGLLKFPEEMTKKLNQNDAHVDSSTKTDDLHAKGGHKKSLKSAWKGGKGFLKASAKRMLRGLLTPIVGKRRAFEG